MRKKTETSQKMFAKACGLFLLVTTCLSGLYTIQRNLSKLQINPDRSGQISVWQGPCLKTFIDRDCDGRPDEVKTRFASSFTVGAMGYDRSPTQEEVDWYRGEVAYQLATSGSERTE